MPNIYFQLGSNSGDSRQVLEHCKNLLSENFGPTVKESSIYQTEPWGIEDQSAFLNQVIEIKSPIHDPIEVLSISQSIEKKLGRTYESRWKSRIIDIDILYIDGIIFQNEILQIPHRYIPFRKFVLVPLAEIAPNFVHPVYQENNMKLLKLTEDMSVVTLLNTANL